MSEIKVVAFTGNLGTPSRAQQLAEGVVAALAEQAEVRAELIELMPIASALAGALRRDVVPDEVEAALRAVEQADLLVVSTPVYRGSYSGLFKHFFDLIDQDSLADVPVILAAAGSSDRHALVVEHALRPLFSFFRAQTVPVALYGSDADFGGHAGLSQTLLKRARRAAQQGLQLVRRPSIGFSAPLNGASLS